LSQTLNYTKDGYMKKSVVLSIGMALMLVVALPLLAQAPDAPAGYAHTNVIVFNAQSPNKPSGILPLTFKEVTASTEFPIRGRA
jgi:hypothetical protein